MAVSTNPLEKFPRSGAYFADHVAFLPFTQEDSQYRALESFLLNTIVVDMLAKAESGLLYGGKISETMADRGVSKYDEIDAADMAILDVLANTFGELGMKVKPRSPEIYYKKSKKNQ